MFAVFYIAVILAALFWAGSPDSWKDEAIVRLAPAVTVFLVFPFVFAWKMIRTPPILEKEKDEIIADKDNKINELSKTKMTEEALILRTSALSILREEGYDLLVERITDAEFKEWRNRVTQFNLKTIAVLRTSVSHASAVSFRTIFFQTKGNFSYKINDEHNELLKELKGRTDILTAILEENKKYWMPMNHKHRIEANALISLVQDKRAAADGN